MDPIAGDLGIAARQARRLVADGRSKDNDPLGADHRATGVIERGIAGVTTTMTMPTMCKQTLVSGSGDDGDCALSLTQEVEDHRAEPRVAQREFG